LYKLSTVRVFLTDTEPGENLNAQGEDEWPPLRKVGSFDPYSDDPRLGIQKIFLCKYSGYLAVAGTAGQVAGWAGAGGAARRSDQGTLGLRARDRERPSSSPWALGSPTLRVPVVPLFLGAGRGVGGGHGFGLFDHQQRRQVFVKCTLHPSDQLALEGPLSRVKSLKKSLRQSFRRIRRSRVSSRKRRPAGPPGEVPEGGARAERTGTQNMELAPVQRKIEARSAEDSFTGFVRTLYFADTYLRDSSRHCPSLWAGTNGGTVYAFALRVPPTERRMDEPVRAEQAKEIQLMHRAPVVGILVLDGHSVPLPEPLEVAHDLSKSPDMQGSHQLLVVSEEQFKVFTLPKVSAKLKLKLTALEGSRVRRGAAGKGSMGCCGRGQAGLTDFGELLREESPVSRCRAWEPWAGLTSRLLLPPAGFYLISPSEFERFSLSTKWLVEPRCLVDSAETKSHSCPRNGSDLSDTPPVKGGETFVSGPASAGLFPNPAGVLKEIQSTLEGDRGSSLGIRVLVWSPGGPHGW
uniref:Lethal giant larvae homologue 2 domain-containing protein n=1 Tax=Panthera tigris altaica TaxID=74533 RepID=A0A8C9MC34_PANTA